MNEPYGRERCAFIGCARKRVNDAGALLILMLFLGGLTTGWILRGVRENDWRIGPPPTRWHPAILVSVVDGDTIKVKWDTQVTSVRMLNINTPERGQSGYREAADHLKAMIGDAKAVMLEFETDGVHARDSFGRLLCYVWLNGKNLCVEQVRAGHSAYWAKYDAGKYPTEFQAAMQESQSTPAP